jgi:hypothetical protein
MSKNEIIGSGPGRFSLPLGILIAILSIPLTASLHGAGSVTLAWDANTAPGVSGYNLYYGETIGNYTNKVVAGNVTSFAVAGLTESKTYYFVVTCHNASGLESDFSNLVSFRVPDPNSGPAISAINVTENGPAITWNSVSGTSYSVFYKDKLSDSLWTPIPGSLLAGGNSLNWVDANASASPQRFYRIAVLP